jgi:putative hemolysin
LQQLRLLPHTQLPTQGADGHPNGLGERVSVLAPDVLEQLLCRHQVAGSGQQVAQYGELLQGQIQLPAAAVSQLTGGVQPHVPDGEHRRGTAGLAAQHCSQPGRQLGEGERLDQVVVGAHVETADAVRQPAPGGQHHDPQVPGR